MNDYQMPLFDRYDLSVEFDRYMARIRKALRENWKGYSSLTDVQIVDQFYDGQTICPLELVSEHTSIVHVERRAYEFAIRYRGDDELWHLYPVDVMRGMLGEVFRGELLMQTIANSQDAATKIFQARLSEIRAVIEQQNQRIEAFEDALPALICGEISKIRLSQPASYSSLVH